MEFQNKNDQVIYILYKIIDNKNIHTDEKLMMNNKKKTWKTTGVLAKI